MYRNLLCNNCEISLSIFSVSVSMTVQFPTIYLKDIKIASFFNLKRLIRLERCSEAGSDIL